MWRLPDLPILRWQTPRLIWALLVLLAVPGLADPADHGLSFELRDFGSRASPLLPPPGTFSAQLVLDDDSAEAVFGFGGGTARQLLWFNSFENPGPLTLEEIWVLFPSGGDAPLGGDVQLVVFFDPDGDPANGAQLLAEYDVTIQADNGVDFSIYPLPMPLDIDGGGDVLIGVVNRYFMTGVDPPIQPAAYDSTTSQDRSYFALWPGDPPDPPDLASATVVDVLGGLSAGNFMIRGFGTAAPAPAVEVPTLPGIGLAALSVLLGLTGVVALKRRG